MRKFYLQYENNAILQQLVAEIPWGQNLLKKYLPKSVSNENVGDQVRKMFDMYKFSRK